MSELYVLTQSELHSRVRSGEEVLGRARAMLELHNRVLASDAIGRTMQQPSRRRAASQRAVLARVGRVDHVADPHFTDDG